MSSAAGLNCASCDEQQSFFFSCDSCEELVESSNASSSERVWYCDFCVVQHTKKGHSVKNFKGHSPLVCSEHKIVHSEFCQTCDVTFCLKCFGEHREHKLRSAKERANELRKEIFEILTDFEMSEKPLQSRKRSADDRNDKDELVELVTREADELKETLIERIDKTYTDHQGKLVDVIAEIGNLQQQARNVLSLDNCELIHNFKQLCVISAQFKTHRDFVMSGSFPNKDQATAELEKCFQSFKQTVLLNLQPNLAINGDDHSRGKTVMKIGNRNSGSDVENVKFEFYSSVSSESRFLPPLCYRLLVSADVIFIQKISKPILDGRIGSGKQITCRPCRKPVKKFFLSH